MKKYFIATVLMLGLGVLCWAQGSKDLFDGNKSEAELEIMKGILSTTIIHVAQNQQKDPWRLNTSNMSAYYLVGQGAVFVIPTPTLRRLNLNMSQIQTLAITREAQRQAAELSQWAIGAGQESGAGSGIGSGVGPGPAAPPAPPKLPAPPASPQVDREELRKKVEEYQVVIKKNREDAAANQEEFLESLKEIRAYLIEALANYGDSLTQVKPSEYINLILATNTLDDTDSGRMKTRHDIISAQKSWITDYKAGRITLDNFKQKVLRYTE